METRVINSAMSPPFLIIIHIQRWRNLIYKFLEMGWAVFYWGLLHAHPLIKNLHFLNIIFITLRDKSGGKEYANNVYEIHGYCDTFSYSLIRYISQQADKIILPSPPLKIEGRIGQYLRTMLETLIEDKNIVNNPLNYVNRLKIYDLFSLLFIEFDSGPK